LKNIHSDFEIEFTNIAEKQRQIDKLSKKIKSVDEVIVATDDDREGEGIAWHVLQLFQLPLSTKRIKFNSITKEAENIVTNKHVIQKNTLIII
jgi:DNA topoisomerase I